MPAELRVRRSLTELQDEFRGGNKKPLEDLMRSWRGVKALGPGDPRSFFVLGGYHGEPFRGAGWGSSAWWGGYCNHGNILFPTWHRMYLVKVEEALRSIEGCADVTLPFWDETSEESLEHGIPWALTDEKFELDGERIDNPLRSFKFPAAIRDNINTDDPNYSKPKGYETVRYPLSGLVGTDKDRIATKKHNAQHPQYDENVKALNANVIAWLTSAIVVDKKKIGENDVARKYRDCLLAPNYTVFSNTSSAAEWNTNLPVGTRPVVPLEQPHNDIHLAAGGFDVPNQPDFSHIAGANGDMGENDTAALDPIFYFHHCHIDRLFWLWQNRWGHREDLGDPIWEYPGTNSIDSQGPTPGIGANEWLTLDTHLNPFKKSDETPYTSRDCVDIEGQLGYTYGPGSLTETESAAVAAENAATKVVRISGVNRAPIRGSFLISAFARVGGKRVHLGTHGVLSRWSVQGCANCQTHLEVKAHFPVDSLDVDESKIEVEIRTRDGVLAAGEHGAAALALPHAPRRLFHLEVH